VQHTQARHTHPPGPHDLHHGLGGGHPPSPAPARTSPHRRHHHTHPPPTARTPDITWRAVRRKTTRSARPGPARPPV